MKHTTKIIWFSLRKLNQRICSKKKLAYRVYHLTLLYMLKLEHILEDYLILVSEVLVLYTGSSLISVFEGKIDGTADSLRQPRVPPALRLLRVKSS